jgi:hypothetical protein
MGTAIDHIPEETKRWIEAQPMFFVATATTDPNTHVNVSPRGLDTFRILDENRVAWLDLTGSGVETIAHLKADGRITLMFCAFYGRPQITRLYGHGSVHEPSDEVYAELRPRFPDLPGERAIVDVAVSRVSSSCGFGVPLMEYIGEREEMVAFAERKGESGMNGFRRRFNEESIDGLPGLRAPDRTEGAEQR